MVFKRGEGIFYVFNIYSLTRARATGLITELRAQIETCVQGGGEKGIARHVKLNKKVRYISDGCTFKQFKMFLV